MAHNVSEVMATDPVRLAPTASLQEAARQMRDADVGDVIVIEESDRLRGIVTDRDIAIRAVADGLDPSSTSVGDICSSQLVTLAPNDTLDAAARRMREADVRRLPVVQDDRVVGVVSIGDLAIERDSDSALADISAAKGNQ